MRFPKILVALILVVVGCSSQPVANRFAQQSSTTQDIYGGSTALKCVNSTGYFHVEKIGTRWWFCTPLGNTFYMQGVYAVDYGADAGYESKILPKYGSATAWAVPTLERLQGWGFNSLNLYANQVVLPFATDPSYPLDENKLHSIPLKVPFIFQVRPAMYSMENPVLSINFKPVKLLPVGHEVKDIAAGWSTNYKGYRPPAGVADYFDSGMQTWLDAFLTTDTPNMHNSPYVNYVMGITYDDGDEMFGFGAGPDFPTVPAGHNNPNLGWVVATMTPIQTALQLYPTVYLDTTVYTKKAWHDYLVQKYKTIQALNTSWTSNYTSFDSSGSKVTGEAVATSDGATTTYLHILRNRTSTPYSLQLLENGQVFGPGITGAIVPYPPGNSAVALYFTTAPPKGTSITMNYVQNGWGTGTGLMDEDGRKTHQAWLGSDFTALSNSNANVKADMDAFLFQMANQYLSVCKTEIKKTFPNYLLFGPDSFGSWQAPPPAQVLQAAATNLDVMIGGVGIQPAAVYQAKLDFVEKNLGEKPLMTGAYLRANPASPLAAFATPADYPNQTARGTAFYTEQTFFRSVTYTKAGSQPFVGLSWFSFIDSRAEEANWGLVTFFDNAYDGNEDKSGLMSCSAPLQMYSCGREEKAYGDVITSVKAANSLWK
jgi:hypothetical protein